MSTPEDVAFDRAYVQAHGLYGFLKLCFHVICPAEVYKDGPHIQQVCNHVEAALLGFVRRLIIEVPPGSLKSVIASVIANAYVWGPLGRPSKKFLYVAYEPDQATKDARRCQALIESEWFQDRWPTTLQGAKQITYYTNDKGGFRRSCSIEGGITGKHPDVTIVDDPTNAKHAIGSAALLKTALTRAVDLWNGVISMRASDPKTNVQIVIMQRLHEADLAGFLQSQKEGMPWTVLRLPMYFEASDPCFTYLDSGAPLGGDWRGTEGEPLCPARWDEAWLQDKKHHLGNEWSAQYQQRPSNVHGQIFQRKWFKYWDADELKQRGANVNTGDGFDELICSWDFTFKGTAGSDFVCGQVWARLGADYFLLERVYKRMNFPQSLQAIQAMCRRWPRIGAKVVEDKANGPAVIASLERKLPGLVPWENSKGKIANANAVSYLHRAGNVWYPPGYEHEKGDESHVECMAKFPFARHDDTVDAETQALAYFESNQNTLFAAIAAAAAEDERAALAATHAAQQAATCRARTPEEYRPALQAQGHAPGQ